MPETETETLREKQGEQGGITGGVGGSQTDKGRRNLRNGRGWGVGRQTDTEAEETKGDEDHMETPPREGELLTILERREHWSQRERRAGMGEQ